MVLLLAAKLATIAVPFTFKWATDALIGQGSAPVAASDWLLWALAAPVAMTVAYGGMRILMAALTQMRDGVFAKVSMHAVRRSRSAPSCTCTTCRCASISSARPAA